MTPEQNTPETPWKTPPGEATTTLPVPKDTVRTPLARENTEPNTPKSTFKTHPTTRAAATTEPHVLKGTIETFNVPKGTFRTSAARAGAHAVSARFMTLPISLRGNDSR